jgi:hypothetical protein
MFYKGRLYETEYEFNNPHKEKDKFVINISGTKMLYDGKGPREVWE